MNNNFNTDGFNERNNYIRNSVDSNMLKKNPMKSLDNSLAKMRIDENRPDIKSYDSKGNVNDNIVITKESMIGNIERAKMNLNNLKKNNFK